MNHTYQIPVTIDLFKGQPQALPVHSAVLGIESGKMVFYNDGIGIDFKLILQGIADSYGFVVAYVLSIDEVGCVNELIEILPGR